MWLAAGGNGWVSEDNGGNDSNSGNYNSEHKRVKYKSDSRILLVGAGADEQCAGYGRHKTKYKQSRLVPRGNHVVFIKQSCIYSCFLTLGKTILFT